ncbi:MAG: hypothetical protein F4038_07230 [Chloroflexi bacterium]|nr:hypothetical protein [Chloroflexota bacterium]MYJ92825.1 hypothetical protein [Chloroflexota bacterium]
MSVLRVVRSRISQTNDQPGTLKRLESAPSKFGQSDHAPILSSDADLAVASNRARSRLTGKLGVCVVPMPSEAEVSRVLLLLLHRSESGMRTGDAIVAVSVAFPQITESDLNETVPSGENRWQNRVRWARNDLVKAGLLDPSQHGFWLLTKKGHEDARRIFP